MSNARERERSAGFTLVELLVVFLFLTLLAMFASANVIGASDARADPRAAAELSLAAQLVRLAGVAVLLFGGGFWYLVELHEPGRLDRFRIGHFLLLASTYALFFAVFGVLGAHEVDAWLAVAVAAGVCYPLVTLHVARIVDWPFALRSALPLVLLTTASVVNGVYGGELRAFVWLGMACVVVAVLTMTYPALARGWDRRREQAERALAARITAFAPDVMAARELEASTRALLAVADPVELSGLRDWIDRRLGAVREVLEEHERVVSLHDAMESVRRRAQRTELRRRSEDGFERLVARARHACAALTQATDALRRHRSDAAAVDPGDGGHPAEHCVACGHAVALGARFCPGCGARAAEARRCRRCEAVLRLPHHLLLPGAGPLPATHCLGCGERHAG